MSFALNEDFDVLPDPFICQTERHTTGYTVLQ